MTIRKGRTTPAAIRETPMMRSDFGDGVFICITSKQRDVHPRARIPAAYPHRTRLESYADSADGNGIPQAD